MKVHDNLNDLHQALCMEVATSPLPVKGGGGTQVYDIVARSRSLAYELDLAETWLTPSRWNVLTRQYLNEPAVTAWLDHIEDRMSRPRQHGVAFVRTNTVQPRKSGGGRLTRRWGSCMLGMSFRRYPEPRLTLHSRSTFLGYIARLDLGVAARLGSLVGERIGLTREEISFTWYLEQGTFHWLRSMPWWFQSDEARALIKDKDSEYLSVQGARSHLKRFAKQDKAGVLYGDEAYQTYRTVRMKWHQSAKPPGFGDAFFGEGEYANVRQYPRIQHTRLDDLPFRMDPSDSGICEGDYEGEDEE